MKKTKTLILSVFVIVGVGILSVVVFLLFHQNQEQLPLLEQVSPDISINETPTPPAQLMQDTPITTKKNTPTSLYIKIPILGINAPVESVGLTEQGAVDIPRKYTNAAWYNLGPYPGEIGNTVIVGHFGWKNGKPGVFNTIHTLRKGDQIYIENAGKRITFTVREVRTYRADEIDKDIFYSSDGKAHLNLITCEGVWDSVTKSYPDRLIVFSDISEESI